MDFPKLDAAIAAGVYELWETDTEAMIRAAESALGVTLPLSFREFSLRYGQINIGDSCLGGARIAEHWTPIARREYGLPKHYVVFEMDDGDVAIWALDTSRPRGDGEYPVVLIDFSEGGALSYDEYLEMHDGNPGHDVGSDFHSFVEEAAESSQRAHAKYAAMAKRSAAATKGSAKAKAAKKAAGKSKKVTKTKAAAFGRKAAKKQPRKAKSTVTSARKRVKAARRKPKR